MASKTNRFQPSALDRVAARQVQLHKNRARFLGKELFVEQHKDNIEFDNTTLMPGYVCITIKFGEKKEVWLSPEELLLKKLAAVNTSTTWTKVNVSNKG